jgi:hypothetical protein
MMLPKWILDYPTKFFLGMRIMFLESMWFATYWYQNCLLQWVTLRSCILCMVAHTLLSWILCIVALTFQLALDSWCYTWATLEINSQNGSIHLNCLLVNLFFCTSSYHHNFLICSFFFCITNTKLFCYEKLVYRLQLMLTLPVTKYHIAGGIPAL